MSEVQQAPEPTMVSKETAEENAAVKNDEDPVAEQQPEAAEAEVSTESYIQEDVDAELEEMKRRLAQMEAESLVTKDGVDGADQADDANGAVDGKGQGTDPNGTDAGTGAAAGRGNGAARPGQGPQSPDSVADADARSIYVGNVDYSATGDQLSAHFQDCGTINRVTIMCNKATGQPKGYAYIEFQDYDAAQNALILNDSMFLGRPLKIVAKRTNIPAMYRGGYGRGRGRYVRGGRGYMRRPRRMRGRWAPY